MPKIDFGSKNGWQNYHLTVGNDIPRYVTYDASDLGPCDQPSTVSGPERFRMTSGPLQSYLSYAYREGLVAGLLGTGWSFSPLVGRHELELDLTGLRGCSIADDRDLHAECRVPSDEIALVSGGTTLRCLAEWAACLSPKRSIVTSGTHLGPTVAGGFGTASHGSRLGFGGVQDMVLGMHLVTGPDKSVWIERNAAPVLSDEAAQQFSNRSPIRDDDVFADALVHLGGMGIVNGVALRLVPYVAYDVLAVVQPLWKGWSGAIQEGRFADIAAHLGHADTPVFYEVSIDPFDQDVGRKAIHLMYFLAGPGLVPPGGGRDSPLPRASDAITAYVEALLSTGSLNPNQPPFSAFGYYEQIFREAYKEFTLPIEPDSPKRGWERLHQDQITGNFPGALYNASYAVPRSEFGRALPLLAEAADGLQQSFLYTMRFVTDSSGTLAFTRFPETVVIEIDGVSDQAPDEVKHLGVFTKTGAMKIRTEFDTAGLDYSMHWAKLGQLDAPKVERDFGATCDPRSLAGRWNRTRLNLVGKSGDRLFRNDALLAYGLIKR